MNGRNFSFKKRAGFLRSAREPGRCRTASPLKPPVRSLAWASACGCGRSSRAARREWSSARTLAAGNAARPRSIVVLSVSKGRQLLTVPAPWAGAREMRVGADAARAARRRSSAFRQGSRRSKSRREIRHRTTVVFRQRSRAGQSALRRSHVIIFRPSPRGDVARLQRGAESWSTPPVCANTSPWSKVGNQVRHLLGNLLSYR
jgi:hypothetical protein